MLQTWIHRKAFYGKSSLFDISPHNVTSLFQFQESIKSYYKHKGSINEKHMLQIFRD